MFFAPTSDRSWSRVAVTGAVYLAAGAFAVALTRFGGGAAFLWIAGAVLLASLIATPRRHWWPLVAVCWLAAVVVSGVWGLGWALGPVLATINVAEPILAAALIVRWNVHRSALDSMRDLGLFALSAGLLAPASTGLFGAAVIGWASHTGFADNFLRWYIGHALGALTFTPIFAQLASGELGRSFAEAPKRQIGEAAALLLLVAAVTAGVFGQSRLPMLFLPVLPLMLITFKVGKFGSSAAVVVITVLAVGLTLAGRGPVVLIQGGVGERLQFLQFYLAMTVMTVLPVVADLTRRSQLFERLRDSEARFRLLTEHSTDIVLNLDVNGIIRYASPSIALLGGYDPAALAGTPSVDLIDPADRERVTAVHLQALRQPDRTFIVEYRGLVRGGEPRWFETHTRAVIDGNGIVRGVVSAIRDTSQRRQLETELAQAAYTDALTGVSNRRAFDRELAKRLDGTTVAPDGCVAIFDLDHFKRVNDTFGHAVGDDILRAFARIAATEVSGDDIFARIGGEEFGVIFSRSLPEQAHAVCERIRRAVARARVKAGERPVTVTVSIGIGRIGVGDSVSDVMRRADDALYSSKQQGRNRSSLAA